MDDDNTYADDYVHHSVMGQPNFDGDNTDFVHHAALYGAYLASKESEQKKSEKKAEARTSANGSSTTSADTNDGHSGCLILFVLIVVIGLVLYFII